MTSKFVKVMVTFEYHPEDYALAYGDDDDRDAAEIIRNRLLEAARESWRGDDWGRVRGVQVISTEVNGTITVSRSSARSDPHAAARVVLLAWEQGGDLLNAWEVLRSAIGPEAARQAVIDVAGDEVAGSLLGVVARLGGDAG